MTNTDITRHIARQFLESIVSEADGGSEHYAPCFRDCLSDNLDWVAEKLAQLMADRELAAFFDGVQSER